MGWWRQRGMELRRRRRALLVGGLIAAVAVLVRLVYWLQYVALPVGRVAVGADVLEYDRWAHEILAGQALWTELPIHGPLYPLWLAGAYAVTGVSLPAVRLLQLGLDLVSLSFVALALWRLVNARTALICAGLWTLYQPLIYYSGELVSEGLVVLLVSGVLLCWASAHGPGGRGPLRPWPLAVSAILCGLATITHPLTLCLSVPYLAWCVKCSWQRLPRRRLVAFAGLLVGLMALPILPVALRNAMVSGELVLVQAHEGLNLFIGNNPEATGTCYVRPGKAYEDLVNWPLQAGVHSEAGARRFFRQQVVRFVVARPWRAAWLVVRKALLTWNAADLPSGADLPILQALTAFMRAPLLRFGFVGPLALAAWAVTPRRRRLGPFLWAPAFGTVALAVLVTSGRYRLMFAPALIAGAALACEGLWRAWKRDDRRTWVRAVALALAGLTLAYGVPVPALPGAETEAVTLLAEAAWRTGEARQAEHLVRYGLTTAPRAAALHHLLGNVLQEAGRGEEAVAAFREALAIDPDRTAAVVDLAICLASMGAREEALGLLQRASEAPDAPAEVWYNVGVLHEQQGAVDAAASAYRRALARDPTHASARLNLGVLLLRAGEGERAAAELAVVVRLRPRDDKALAALAVYHAERGEYEQAGACFERALAANPTRADVQAAYQHMREEAAGRRRDRTGPLP